MYRAVALAFLLALTPAGSTFAQTNRGSITGTVTDPHGAAIAGAVVLITNSGTNQVTKARTSASGVYSAEQLDPVQYRIAIEVSGFRRETIENIKVDTASTTTIDIHMEIGKTSESISVLAESPLINVDETAAGTTITQRELEDSPLADRFVLGLALTVPNVSGTNQTDNVGVFQNTLAPGQGFNINGSRPGEATFLADGVSNTGLGFSRAVVTFSPDTTQEFKVQTSNFSAEYGNTGGGVISFTTKSGTNRLNGSLSGFLRNPLFNATPFTDATVRPASQLRDFDGVATLGGPVYLPRKLFGPLSYNGRNKTFFFASFEPRWRSDGLSQTSIVAPNNWRQGDFSDMVNVNGNYLPQSAATQLGYQNATPVLIYQQFTSVGNQLVQLPAPAAGQTYVPFPGNKIPASMLDPTSQRIIKEGLPPAGNWFLNGAVPQNYAYLRGLSTTNKPVTVRIDHHLNDKTSIYGRFTTVPNSGSRSRGYFTGSDVNQFQTDYSSSKQLLIGNTYIVTPAIINDLRLNYLRGNYTTTNSPDWQTKNWSTQLGLPSLTVGGLPQFNFSSQGMFTIGQNSIVNIGARIEETYNIADTLTWTHGAMTWKFGGDLRNSRMKTVSQAYATGGIYRFQSLQTNSGGTSATGGADFASFLLGVPNNETLQNSYLPYYYRWNADNLFVQNDWKVRSNLTLSFGLRYSIDLPRTEKYDNQAAFDPTLTTTVPMPTQLFNTNGTPFTGIPANLIPATTQVPVLQFSGHGNSHYLNPPDWKEFQPRFGFAWSPRIFANRSVVVRGGYGLSYLPVTGTDISPSPNFSLTGQTYGINSGQTDPNYVTRLSSNPPSLTATAVSLNVPVNGRVSTDSLAYQSSSYLITQGFKVPYSQTFSLAVQTEVSKGVVLEIGYSGNKGTHLFFPSTNLNAVPFGASQALSALNLTLTSLIQDPLKRHSTPGNPNSPIINVPIASVLAPYSGFTSLFNRYETGADSTHHAGYVTLQRRFSHGLLLRSTYTFQKTITDASETGVCTPCGAGSRVWSQISFGASHQQEKGIASFNQPQIFVTTASYDLPVGKGQMLLRNAPRWADTVVGGWKLSGIGTIQSGTPMVVSLFDTNGLSSLTQGSGNAVVRPDVVPGVPQKNPLYDPRCAYGTACQPYANPAAFQRPALGQIGNAPATLPQLYTPSQRNLDISVVKVVRFGESGRRYLQFKMDAINVFNYRGFAMASGNSFNGAWLTKLPTSSDINSTEFNSWATAWNQTHAGDQIPIQVAGQPNNAVFQQVVSLTAVPKAANGGVLPNTFYSVPLPTGFAFADPNSFDLRTLNGLKDYRLRSGGNYNTTWGTLTYYDNARFLQFSVKIVF